MFWLEVEVVLAPEDLACVRFLIHLNVSDGFLVNKFHLFPFRVNLDCAFGVLLWLQEEVSIGL
jgi:hypothetical protein